MTTSEYEALKFSMPCGRCGTVGWRLPNQPAQVAEPVRPAGEGQCVPVEAKKRWPFVESPGAFADRLRIALSLFDNDLLAAVRNVLIESPPEFAANDQRDAARYRWLRDAWLADVDAGEDIAWAPIMHSCSEAQMDSDIDRAIELQRATIESDRTAQAPGKAS